MTKEEALIRQDATLEDLFEAIKETEQAIDMQKTALRMLESKACDLSPFKIGEKVFVNRGYGEEQLAFISGIQVDYTKKLIYKFNKPNKNGAMSGHGAGIWHYLSIKKAIK